MYVADTPPANNSEPVVCDLVYVVDPVGIVVGDIVGDVVGDVVGVGVGEISSPVPDCGRSVSGMIITAP